MNRKKDNKKPDDELPEQLAYLRLPFVQQHFQELASEAGDITESCV